MPVAQGGPPPLRQVVLVGLGVVMTLGTVLFMITQSGQLLDGDNEIDFDIGDGIYRSGIAAEDLAPAIAEQGPFLLPDLAGGDTDIFLQHIGDEADEGWLAIAARPAVASRDCLVTWVPEDETFVDSCDGTVYPPDGEGLSSYPVTIDGDGKLEVNLNVVLPAGG